MDGGIKIEVISGTLFWLPDVVSAPEGFEGAFLPVNMLCAPLLDSLQKSYFKNILPGTYGVPHYGEHQHGCAFGPLSLDQVLWFCRGVENHFDMTPKLAVGAAEATLEEQTCTAVLLGAYLLLMRRWPVKKVSAAIGAQYANLTFTCSWARKHEGILTVQDCLRGLEHALQFGWLDSSALDNDAGTASFCADYHHMAHAYDATWIVPGRVLVLADPETTAGDPSDCTCKRVFSPRGNEGDEGRPSCDSAGSELHPPGIYINNSLSHTSSAPESPSTSLRTTRTCNTVCKDYSRYSSEGTAKSSPSCSKEEIPSFASVLKQKGVQLVVRANFLKEPGMRGCSYESRHFEHYGIQHAEVPILDFYGAVPSAADIAKFQAATQHFLLDPQGRDAVAIHCKGGFGRSISLICWLLAHRYPVTGEALLGWVRMIRPGAVTTLGQEHFIVGLKSRRPLWRDPVKAGCQGGCVVT